MTSLVVESPGFLTTVQDFGRPGHGVLGISASGAADPIALQLGNRLVGNPRAFVNDPLHSFNELDSL